METETRPVKPVNLPHAFARCLVNQRIGVLVLPLQRYRSVAEEHLLWVREGVTVLDRQPRRDMLSVAYAGEARPYQVAWPRSRSKPGPGHRPAEAMPMEASRYTLLVREVLHLRLFQVPLELGLRAGVWEDHDGFACVGYPFMRGMRTHTAALQFLHQHNFPEDEPNPEVVAVSFRVSTKNIAMVIKEGAKW